MHSPASERPCHSMSPGISTRQLTKRYGDLIAVDHVDLEVLHGEVFGFLGPNGAGKSTTIRCLLDLSRPSSGTANVLGFDSRHEAIEIHRRVGFLPGDLALYDNLTGAETVEYFANLRGGVAQSSIDTLAERFDADLSRRCSEYSSGSRQKVGLIQAFMHSPDLLILDEPTTGLDPLVQDEVHKLITEVRAEGRTVFLSSHTLSEVDRVADRVGIIRHGRLVEVASVQGLKAKSLARLDFEFAEEVDPEPLRRIGGVREVTGEGRHWSVTYEGPIDVVLNAGSELGIVNLHSREADLEEIFLGYYRDDPATGVGNRGGAPGDTGPDTPASSDESPDVR